jgi:UV DNA damage repair endonuclease
VFRREFLQIGNIEMCQEAVTIASTFNKVLRKLFLKTDTVGLIHTGGYSGNVNYSK